MIKAWLKRRPKKSDPKSTPAAPENRIDPDVLSAIAQDKHIADDDKAAYAKEVDAEVKRRNLNGDEKKAYIIAACAIAAGASVAYSPNAQALCGSIQAQFERALVNAITDPFEEQIIGLFEAVTGTFDAIASLGASTNASSTTAAADAQNAVNKKIADKKAQAAAAPPPDPCGSDSNSQRIQAATAKAPVDQGEFNTRFQLAMLSDLNDAWSEQFKNRSQSEYRYMDDALNAGFALRQKTSSDGASAKQKTDDFFIFALGEMPSNRMSSDLVKNYESDDTAMYVYNEKQTIATQTARQQIAVNGMSLARSAHGNESEPGVVDTLKEEVSRTYGSTSEGWRNEIRSYADPTPGAIELVLQLSLQSKIQLETLEALKAQNLTLGTQLLGAIDNGE